MTASTTTRAQANKQAHKLLLFACPKRPPKATVACLLVLSAGLAIIVASVGANSSDYPTTNTNQASDSYSSNYGQQQQQQQEQHHQPQQQQPTKAKKIQIVYIKVPLAKLKPSLTSNGDSQAHLGSIDNSTAYSGQVKGSNNATDANTKTQGSQTPPIDETRQQQSSSFLIPMAVVQEQSISPAASMNLASFNEANTPTIELGRVPSGSGGGGAQTGGSQTSSMNQANQPNQSGSYRAQMLQTNLVWPEMAAAFNPQTGDKSLEQTNSHSFAPPAARKSRANPAGPQQWSQAGVAQGFMSAFLSAEKEKLNSAAAMIMQQQQQQHQSSRAPNQMVANSAAPTNQQNQITTNQRPNEPFKPSGGLMPVVMAPFSHMPDNMIGQAYNAAVRQALPVESGLPASSLMSSSSMLDSVAKHGRDLSNINNNNNNLGGKSGISGDVGSSLQTSSGASYGANGQNPFDATSGANNYQGSGSGYVNSAQSLGSGNGINSFGASVAFSDYPTGSGQAPVIYGQHHLTASSSNNNNNNLAHQSTQQPLDQLTQQKLKQAKKTIIPIVVQVEHAILENNDIYGRQRQPMQSNDVNKYSQQQQQQQQHQPLRSSFVGLGKRGKQAEKGRDNSENGNNGGVKGASSNQVQGIYGASSNEVGLSALLGSPNVGAQYVNAANAQDINQITAAINAENAASAAAALAQADMAFGNGSPAFMMPQSAVPQQHRPQRPSPMSHYASGLQSAASALFANTHPMIQAAASNGIGSVSKLGAKLGEMIALPSMQVPNVINSLSSSLPSAFSSLSSQMGAQLNQAVQQVAKEHPTASAFARQVAQQAGINLPQLSGPQQHALHSGMPNGNPMTSASSLQQVASQMIAGASQLSPQTILSSLASSPQAQFQNLKLSIGQNLQSAAAQLAAVHQKNPAAAASLLASSPLAPLYPASVNAALKQATGGFMGEHAQVASGHQGQVFGVDPHHAQSSSMVPVIQSENQFGFKQNPQQQQQMSFDSMQGNIMEGSASDLSGQSSKNGASVALNPTKSSTLKSKFLAFFQPPKFISNFLSWNDRADDRNDQGAMMTSSTLKESPDGMSTKGSATMTTVPDSASNVSSSATSTSSDAGSPSSSSSSASTAAVSSESKSTSVAPSSAEPAKTTRLQQAESSSDAVGRTSTTAKAGV